MKKILGVAALSVLSMSKIAIADDPASKPGSEKRRFEVMDLFRARRVLDPRLSPDGSRVAFTVTDTDFAKNKRTTHVWLAPTDASKGEARQLTFGEGNDSQPRWSPDGKRLAFVSTRGGSAQVWILRLDGGEATQLTKHSSDVDGPVWSKDGKRLAFNADVEPKCGDAPCDSGPAWVKEKGGEKASGKLVDRLLYRHWNAWRNGVRTHVFVVPSEGGEAKDLTPGDFDSPPVQVGSDDDYVFSPDGKSLIYFRNFDPIEAISTNVDMFLVSTDGGDARNLTMSNTARDLTARFTPDGKSIVYRAMARPGFEADRFSLWKYDLESRERHELTRDFPEAVGKFEILPDGKTILFAADRRGRTPLYSLDLATGHVTEILAGGDHGSFDVSADGRWIAWSGSTIERPAEIYVSRIDRPEEKRLTRLNDPVFDQIQTSRLEEIDYPSGTANIHALLLKPPDWTPKKRYPVMLWIHGGPQGAWHDSFHYRWNPQPFAAAGYVVFMPNIHGSTGYGQKFVDEISGAWGGGYDELMNGLADLTRRGWIDKDRMGAMGASYGGFMVDHILGKTDRFKALMTHAGVYNIPASYGLTEELWFPEWEFGGTPWENPKGYENYSPHLSVKSFRTPTLVSHGELDYRVSVAHGIELFTHLQRKGVPSKFLYFPDEGHWIMKPQNSRLWYETALDWFRGYLKP